jgi:hypothetical protein
MIKADGVDGVEFSEIVSVRDIVSPPSHGVEGGVGSLCPPEGALVACKEFPRTLTLFKAGRRGFKIRGMGKTIRPNRSQFRELERKTEILTNIASGPIISGSELDSELHSLRDHSDLLGRELENPEFSVKVERPRLGYNHELPIGIVKGPLVHVSIECVKVQGTSGTRERTAIHGISEQGIEKVDRGRGFRKGMKAESLGGSDEPAPSRIADPSGMAHFHEFALDHRGSDFVEPGFQVSVSGGREGTSTQLLGIKAPGHLLRRVLTPGEDPGKGF